MKDLQNPQGGLLESDTIKNLQKQIENLNKRLNIMEEIFNPYRQPTFEGEVQKLREKVKKLEMKTQKRRGLCKKHILLILMIAFLILINIALAAGTNTVKDFILGGSIATAFFGFLKGGFLIFNWNSKELNEKLYWRTCSFKQEDVSGKLFNRNDQKQEVFLNENL